MSEISQNRSSLKEFLTSIATIPGDLSNITAPPFVLADCSAVEFPAYWAEHPSIFVAPATEQDPARRALLVLKWFLSSLKQQQYGGRSEDEGVKKPLNAFLGELFMASWEDDKSETGQTRLLSEQVSHHPPVTACYLWNDKKGVRAEGYTSQEVTFSGSVHVNQTGHAILHLDASSEDYLIPMPSVKVSGILSGTPSPELNGTYHIPSSSGFVSEISFSSSSFSGARKLIPGLGKKDKDKDKNAFTARLYRGDDPQKAPFFAVEGSWTSSFTIHDVKADRDIETYNIQSPPAPTPPMRIPPLNEQDPWESRRAWHGVVEALHRGDMKGVSEEKHQLEEGQREMRRKEEREGRNWKQVFFKKVDNDVRVERLLQAAGGDSGWGLDGERTGGIWRVEREKVDGKREADLRSKVHGDLTPTG